MKGDVFCNTNVRPPTKSGRITIPSPICTQPARLARCSGALTDEAGLNSPDRKARVYIPAPSMAKDRAKLPPDFALCANALYHLPRYKGWPWQNTPLLDHFMGSSWQSQKFCLALVGGALENAGGAVQIAARSREPQEEDNQSQCVLLRERWQSMNSSKVTISSPICTGIARLGNPLEALELQHLSTNPPR